MAVATTKLTDAPGASSVTVIRPRTGFIPTPPRVLWEYRELFFFLVWRDIKVRYAQTFLGAAWSVFQPLAMMAVYAYAFTRLGRVAPGSLPYPLFALSGLVVWVFVSRAVTGGSTSLISDLQVVTKTPAPRMLLPLSSIAAMLVDFLISLVLFLIFAAAYGRLPSVRAFALLPILFLTLLLVYGLSLLLSALNVKYRDVGAALPFLVLVWFFLSPIAYSIQPSHSLVGIVQGLNPLIGLVGATRWSLVGGDVSRLYLAAAVLESVVIFGIGLFYFSRVDRTIADDA